MNAIANTGHTSVVAPFDYSETIATARDLVFKVGSALIQTFQSNLPAFLRPAPPKPLIERKIEFSELSPGSKITIVSYPMRYDLCLEGIKESDWLGMTRKERKALESYYADHACDGVTKRISSAITDVFSDVGQRMGLPSSDAFSYYKRERSFFDQIFGGGESVAIDDQNRVSMPSDFAFSLAGWFDLQKAKELQRCITQ